MIEVECECGRVIKTKDENAGKKAKCPDCGEIIQIPAPRRAGSKSAATSGKGAAAAGAKSSKRRPRPEDEFDDGEADPDEDFGDEEDEEAAEARPKSKKSKKSSGDEPSSGKKKKKKKSGNDQDLNKQIIIGTCVVFGLAFLGLAGYGIYNMGSLVGGGASVVVEVPKEYEDWSSQNGELRCKAPKGWEKKSAGGSGGVPASASIEMGNVKIQFKSSQSGASKWMAMNPNNEDTSKMPDEEKPISQLHEYHKAGIGEALSGYDEKRTEMWKNGSGEIRVSEFTASEGFGTIYGYRVTMPGVQSQFNVIAKCSGDQWESFKPVFKTIIESASSN